MVSRPTTEVTMFERSKRGAYPSPAAYACAPAARPAKFSGLRFSHLLAAALLVTPLLKADVPAPPSAPPTPAGFCSTIYNELYPDLQAFNTLLTVPPTWVPIPGGPTLFAGNLQVADGNTGPQLIGPNYMPAVLTQLQEEKALGVQAIMIQLGFPLLYEPYWGSSTAMAPYVTFYQNVATAVHTAGLKLIIEYDVLLSNDIEAGWPNITAYYSTLNWPEYMAGRATMAATVAQTMQPDYLLLAEEPDSEATQAGQPNLNIPADAAQMISGEISAVRASTFPNEQLGAGFGSWLNASGSSSLVDYIEAYVALPLDYIDMHLYPINTENGVSFIDNTLLIAEMAAAAGKPVAISETWLWKMENSEWDVVSDDTYRARFPFSFWAPIDAYFLQTVQALAQYTNMLYVAPDGPDYFFAYQTYGGTTANGGAANCTCTTTYCANYDIVNTETQLAAAANSVADFSSTGLSYYNQLVPPDTSAPSTPTNLTGTAGYTGTTFSWSASNDNVGVAGYNIFRCSPPAQGQPCTGVYLAQTSSTSYADSGLTSNTPYNYQIQAFDVANNISGLSQTLSLLTNRTTSDSPTSLTATAVSPKEIDLAWTPPQNTTGLGDYLIYSGPSPSNLTQIMKVGATTTTYRNMSLAASTTYYYAVAASESGITSPMSPGASATTLPLPNPPVLTASASSPTMVVLNWKETIPTGGLAIANYQVFQGMASGQLTKIATVTGTTYTARSLTGNTTYYYEVVAVDSSYDDSQPSNQAAVTTLPMPVPPTNLGASMPAATQIALTWQWAPLPGGLPIARYLIDCGTSPTDPPQVGIVVSGTSYTYRSATASTKYYCDVVAVDSANDDSAPSTQISVTTPPMPNAPSDVAATPNSSTKATVTWTEILPQNGLPISNYTIFRGTAPSCTLAQVAIRTTPSYIDTSVVEGTTYCYAIEATDTGRDVSPMSAMAQVTLQ